MAVALLQECHQDFRNSAPAYQRVSLTKLFVSASPFVPLIRGLLSSTLDGAASGLPSHWFCITVYVDSSELANSWGNHSAGCYLLAADETRTGHEPRRPG